MDANCVDAPVALIAGESSLLAEALVLDLVDRGVDVHFPASAGTTCRLDGAAQHAARLFPVDVTVHPDAANARCCDALFASVTATRRPLAFAVFVGRWATSSDDRRSVGLPTLGLLIERARNLMSGWDGGRILVVGGAEADLADGLATSMPQMPVPVVDGGLTGSRRDMNAPVTILRRSRRKPVGLVAFARRRHMHPYGSRADARAIARTRNGSSQAPAAPEHSGVSGLEDMASPEVGTCSSRG